MNQTQSLFADAEDENLDRAQPLAARMRPQNLQEFAGQNHVLGEGKLLRRMIDAGRLGSIILSGPPGTGKTTLAHLLAIETGSELRTLSAVSSVVKDVREVLAWATDIIASGGTRLLFIDEIHRFQQESAGCSLAGCRGWHRLPDRCNDEQSVFCGQRALLSRSQLFQLESLKPEDIRCLLQRP